MTVPFLDYLSTTVALLRQDYKDQFDPKTGQSTSKVMVFFHTSKLAAVAEAFKNIDGIPAVYEYSGNTISERRRKEIIGTFSTARTGVFLSGPSILGDNYFPGQANIPSCHRHISLNSFV